MVDSNDLQQYSTLQLRQLLSAAAVAQPGPVVQLLKHAAIKVIVSRLPELRSSDIVDVLVPLSVLCDQGDQDGEVNDIVELIMDSQFWFPFARSLQNSSRATPLLLALHQ